MVRRGSTVRSPLEGFRFFLLEAVFVALIDDGRLVRCPRSVHAVDVDCFGVSVEQVQRVLAPVAGEVSVVAVERQQGSFSVH